MTGGRGVAALGLAALALLSPAGAARPAVAQQPTQAGPGTQERPEVRFSPRRPTSAQARLLRLVEEGRFELWTRDTVLAAEARVPGDLLVLGASARLEGRVEGDVFVVDGDLFLRPTARVEGDVVALGAGYYAASRAVVAGGVTYRPNERLRALPEAGGWRIFQVEEEPPPVELAGLHGFQVPIYQRVDGWTLRLGGTVRAVRWPGRPELAAEARFRTDPGKLEGSLKQRWVLGRRALLELEASRRTRSNDTWIRREFSNTLAYLLAGNDYRDYHRADRAELRVELGGTPRWRTWLGGRWEKARGAEAATRTVLFRDDEAAFRPNPPVDEGRTVSLLAGAAVDRRAAGGRLVLFAELEGATAEAAGDMSFLAGQLWAETRRPLPGGQAIELLALGRGDVAGRLPRQRWSSLGGVGSLPTLALLSQRGPRLLFGEATYAVRLPVLEVPHVGPTELVVRAATGAVWDEGGRPRFEQDVIVGARFLFVETGLAVDPGGRRGSQFFVQGRVPRAPARF